MPSKLIPYILYHIIIRKLYTCSGIFYSIFFNTTSQAFGAPFIVAHVDGKKEVFFGSDRMELLAYILGKAAPCCHFH